MTKDEFLRTYHEYMTQDYREAQMEANQINAIADGFLVEVTAFPGLGYCLMLSTAKRAIKEMGII